MEEWRKVPGYDYEISIDKKEGRCRNIRTKKELSIRPGRGGYIFWHLCKYGHAKTAQAARWIAQTYPELIVNDYFEDSEIDHIDTDRLNNHPSNLRWVTKKGNMNNQLTRKHLSEASSGKHPTDMTREKLRISHRSKRPWMHNHPSNSLGVIQYSKTGDCLMEYPSISEAERLTGIKKTNISACCKKRRPSAGGFIWYYSKTKKQC